MNPVVALLLVLMLSSWAVIKWRYRRRGRRGRRTVPVSVNYHFSRVCNKSCGFCFHTAKTSYKAPVASAKEGMRLLKESGMRKINFAGGEPFLDPAFLGTLVDFCKQELGVESVSVVTNGSLVREKFFRQHGKNLDILAVSCDSFDEDTNIKIGRGSGNQVEILYRVAQWCREYGVMFKINTVVCKLNILEDMNRHIHMLQPFRWKCFQVLIVDGENNSATDTLRDARNFLVSDHEFDRFCLRHRDQKALVPEPNRLMAKSYLILDEYLRFLDRDGRQPSGSILEVGVQSALESVFWDEESFVRRGGIYEWKKESCSAAGKELDW